MVVQFKCPAGHRIRADQRRAGRRVACPACGGQVEVPRPAPAPITESAAYRLLSECDVAAATPANATPVIAPTRPSKECPRCRTALSASAEICSRCRVRLFPSVRAWKAVCRAAVRQIAVGNRS